MNIIKKIHRNLNVTNFNYFPLFTTMDTFTRMLIGNNLLGFS